MAKPIWKKLTEMTAEEIGKLQSNQNRAELEKIFKSTRRSFAQRRSALIQAGVWSPALSAYESGIDTPIKNPEKMSPQRLYHETIKLKKFFEAETSTVAGAMQHKRNVENRLFGESSVELTQEQHRELWRVYDEWQKAYQVSYSKYGSNQTQRVIGNLITGDVPNQFSDFNELGLADKLKYVNEYLGMIDEGEVDDPIFRTIGNRY